MSLLKRSRWITPLLLGVVTLVIATRGILAQEDSRRKEFMRLKLETAKTLVDGLALENYELLEKSAIALKKLSMGAEWEVVSIPKIEYVAFTSDFQRATDELRDRAKAKNIDGAATAYAQLTAACVRCHKEVRKKIR